MEIEEQAISPTKWFFKVPSYRRLAIYIVLVGFAAGILIGLKDHALADAFLFGGAGGFFILSVPALFSSMLVASVFYRKQITGQLKYFLLAGLIAQTIASIFYLFGIFAYGTSNLLATQQTILIANAIVFVVWFFALAIGFGKSAAKAIPSAFLHPIFNLSLIVLWQAYTTLEPSLNQISLFIIPKLIVASVVMLVALSSLSYLLNAPAKKNFGVSAIWALTLFVAQWVRGSQALEEVLDEMGEIVHTNASVVVFKVKNKLAAVILVPNVHYGPLGNLGGSELPYILSSNFTEKLNVPSLVFHGTALPDFNPVHANQSIEIENALMNAITKATNSKGSDIVSILSSTCNYSHADGFAYENGAVVTLSRAPMPTDDINYASGRALSNLLKAKYNQAIIIDRHNCKTDNGKRKWDVGSAEYEEYEKCIGQLETTFKGKLKVAVASNPLSSYNNTKGIAKGGLKIIVISAGNKKWAMAIFDANNIIPEFKDSLVESVKSLDFKFIDISTTDTHVVNTINGIHNPLGLALTDAEKQNMIDIFVQTAKQANENLEPATISIADEPLIIKVLGSGKASEVTSTVNSILAIAKIIAPLALIVSIALTVLALKLI